MRAQVRVERNEDLKEQRRRNPKRYWVEMNKLLGKEKRGVSGYLTYGGKEVKGKEKMDAWSQMFQGERRCAQWMQRWRRRSEQETRRIGRGHELVGQGLDESIQRRKWKR